MLLTRAKFPDTFENENSLSTAYSLFGNDDTGGVSDNAIFDGISITFHQQDLVGKERLAGETLEHSTWNNAFVFYLNGMKEHIYNSNDLVVCETQDQLWKSFKLDCILKRLSCIAPGLVMAIKTLLEGETRRTGIENMTIEGENCNTFRVF